MSFVRFVFLILWTIFVACVRMKHYTLRFTPPSTTWDSRQQLIVNLSKFKTNINMIRTYIVFFYFETRNKHSSRQYFWPGSVW